MASNCLILGPILPSILPNIRKLVSVHGFSLFTTLAKSTDKLIASGLPCSTLDTATIVNSNLQINVMFANVVDMCEDDLWSLATVR